MSAETYSLMDTDALIDEFIRLAKTLRTAWTLLPKVPEATPERAALKKEILTIGAELRARKPIQKLRPLYDHESADVRAFAAGQFLAIDEEWALATMAALGENLTTREVVALCERARRGPPARPSLKEMSTEQLAERFEDAGMRRYVTQFMGDGDEAWDVELSNSIIGEMIDIAAAMKLRSALPALLPLLDHPNIAVRNDAAAHCLSIAPERALLVLEAIKASPDERESAEASCTLDRWREKGEDASGQ